MSSNNKVILLEFNELSPKLLSKFIREGKLPNFAKLLNGSTTNITDANCAEENLEPWIQWVTLHTGLSFEQHKVHRLGEAHKLESKSIWDVLSEHNKTSWLCGSMNAKWNSNDTNIHALPDPWSMDAVSSPKSLQPFYNFVRANVQEHSNERYKLSLKNKLGFISFMITHGLSLVTCKKIFKAIYRQITKSDLTWRKATVLDWLQFDVFSHVYKKEKPDFSTFFSNSTAHFQHKFWRYMEPENFTLKPTQLEQQKYKDAILYAYQNHDELIGRVFALAEKDTKIILSSALSQQPYTLKDSEGGKRYYRPIDIHQIPARFELLNVDKINPVMSHQFHIVCKDEESATHNFNLLSEYNCQSDQLFSLRLEGENIFGGCRVSTEIPKGSHYSLGEKTFLFDDVFYLADNLKSGMHHPHGVLWVYKGLEKENKQGIIPLEEAFSKILTSCGVVKST